MEQISWKIKWSTLKNRLDWHLKEEKENYITSDELGAES